MPKKRDAEKKPAGDATTNPATAAHTRDAERMDPALEAERSGPPPSGDTMPKPLADPDPAADPAAARPADDADASGLSLEEIDARLTDPTFDPEGHERLRLAEESRSRPASTTFPPTPFVDEHGDPMQVGERHPDRDPEGTKPPESKE